MEQHGTTINRMALYMQEKYYTDIKEKCQAVHLLILRMVLGELQVVRSLVVAALQVLQSPNSITSIGSGAFSYCSGLTSITIPESVTSIENYAFSNCTGLTSIYVLNEIPAEILSQTFSNYDVTLYVPQGSIETYKVANYWSNFTNIVEFDATAIEDIEDDAPAFKVTTGGIQMTAAEGKAVAVYSAAGALVEKIDAYAGEEIALDKGVYIVRVGNKTVKLKL